MHPPSVKSLMEYPSKLTPKIKPTNRPISNRTFTFKKKVFHHRFLSDDERPPTYTTLNKVCKRAMMHHPSASAYNDAANVHRDNYSPPTNYVNRFTKFKITRLPRHWRFPTNERKYTPCCPNTVSFIIIIYRSSKQ